jgi:hypothetical protein
VIHPKVVSLQSDRQRAAPMPPIVNSVRQQSRRHLVSLLKNLLDCTDDALFEMADKSTNNLDHHLYFESMRQIRLHRNEIQKRFMDEVNRHFEDIFTQSAKQAGDTADPDAIQMLNNDDLEISVAISGIVSKITSQFSLPIMELTKRLDHLARDIDVRERQNPLGPQLMSEAFAAAIGCLDVDIKIRIILLKLFERAVMQHMGPAYEEANQMLVEAGVLRDLRDTLNRNRTPRQRRRLPEAPTIGADDARGSWSPGAGSSGPDSRPTGEDGGYAYGGGFGAIQTLLSSLQGPGGRAADPGSVVATAQLLNVLNGVQVESGQQTFDASQIPALVDLRQLVLSRASNVSGRSLQGLSRTDEDVVNFIGLLFDYILNDRNLAIPMKALIARLQIPIVKLAIIDKSFFERTSHPARQLLNELSSAGIGWSSATELKRDTVYDKIESVVVRVLNGFSENPEIFEELLAELRSFRNNDAARNSRMEQRVRETEAGKARTTAAKREVQQVINQKASGLHLPRDIARFLSDVWSRVLVYANLTEGKASAGWQRLIAVLDDLLWSVQTLDDLAQIDQRDRDRGVLVQHLASGMDLVQLPEREKARWLELIREHLEDLSRNDRRCLGEGEASDHGATYVEMDEIILVEPSELSSATAGDLPGEEFLDKITAITEGTWVEITQAAPAPALRCKLTTIVEPDERYVFVNRRGMKVAERTRVELARDLQQERLVVLNDSEVFDRALQAVIGNLRKVQRHRPTA